MTGFLLDFVVLLHFFWVLFILFGLLAMWWRPKLAYVHAGGLLFSLVLNLLGWYCPLTYVENYLHGLHRSGTAYGGTFLGHYLIPLIYPDLPESFLRMGAMGFVGIQLLIYVFLIGKYGLFAGGKGPPRP